MIGRQFVYATPNHQSEDRCPNCGVPLMEQPSQYFNGKVFQPGYFICTFCDYLPGDPVEGEDE